VTRKLKPVEVNLDEEIQEAILGMPVRLPDGDLATVGDLVRRANEAMQLANAAIQENALVQTTATFLMKREKRRGTPTIILHMDGTAVLHIVYGEKDNGPLAVEAPVPTQKSKLPSLDELRRRAAAANVDITDLGRQKKKIIERIEASTGVLLDEPVLIHHKRLSDEVTEGDLPQVSLPGRNR
jgi:hypothetical protein